MPLLTIFAASTQVDDCINAALFHKECIADAERGRHRNIETTVPIQQQRVASIQLQSFFISQKHRDLCSVFAGNEDLLGSELISVQIDLGLAKQTELSASYIVAVNGR